MCFAPPQGGLMSLLKKSLEAFRTHQLNKRLGKAISEQNLDDMRQVLEEGAKAVHIVYYTSTPYGAMPTEEITDPLVFAQKVGLNEEGMALLKRKLSPLASSVSMSSS